MCVCVCCWHVCVCANVPALHSCALPGVSELGRAPQRRAVHPRCAVLACDDVLLPRQVGNCTGFAVNRVFFPYTMAACLLVDLGLSPYQIDAVIGPGGFGMPMGPFRSAVVEAIQVGSGSPFRSAVVEAFRRPPVALHDLRSVAL